jgi:hypothetical protein
MNQGSKVALKFYSTIQGRILSLLEPHEEDIKRNVLIERAKIKWDDGFADTVVRLDRLNLVKL